MDSIHAQLFRYAQDLDDLLAQHIKLQQRHQALLQTQGRSAHSNDQVLELALRSRSPLAVTDFSGTIVRANRTARELIHGSRDILPPACDLSDSLTDSGRADFARVLARVTAGGTAHEAAVICCLEMRDPRAPERSIHCAALALPLQTFSSTAIYWMLMPAADRQACQGLLPQDILPMGVSTCGVIVTDPCTRMLAVNDAYCSITGYSADELLQQPVHVLNSGRHTAEFFESFWARLNAWGSWSGEFLNRRKSGHVYPEWKTVRAIQDLEGNTLFYAAVVRDISEDSTSIEQLSRLAYFDALTGLPNRRLLNDRITQATKIADRDGAPLSLLFIDLDGFKPINDQLGHDVGDLVLQQVALRLPAALRSGDTVARVGGDEFIMLLPGIGTAEAVGGLVDKLLSALAQPIVIGPHRLTIGASVGCARYPADGQDADALIRNADAAMYQSKRRGGHRLSCFASPAETQPRSTLGLDIWQASARGELSVVYHPQVEPVSGSLRSCEARLRWTHPVHGAIAGEQTLAVAEQNGAIVQLGHWTLSTACQEMGRLRALGAGDFLLSVNVSHRELQDTAFAAGVLQVLQEAGWPARLLELAISEPTAALLGAMHCLQLQALREQGVQIAIADLCIGTGALAGLASLPADRLKIDRHFGRELADRPGAHAPAVDVTGVCLTMGMRLIAGGLADTTGQPPAPGQGHTTLNGYLKGSPMNAAQMMAWSGQPVTPLPASP